jgi:hypothetical protein
VEGRETLSLVHVHLLIMVFSLSMKHLSALLEFSIPFASLWSLE